MFKSKVGKYDCCRDPYPSVSFETYVSCEMSFLTPDGFSHGKTLHPSIDISSQFLTGLVSICDAGEI